MRDSAQPDSVQNASDDITSDQDGFYEMRHGGPPGWRPPRESWSQAGSLRLSRWTIAAFALFGNAVGAFGLYLLAALSYSHDHITPAEQMDAFILGEFVGASCLWVTLVGAGCAVVALVGKRGNWTWAMIALGFNLMPGLTFWLWLLSVAPP